MIHLGGFGCGNDFRGGTFAVGNISRMVPLKSQVSCKTMPKILRKVSALNPDINAVNSYAPTVNLIKAH